VPEFSSSRAPPLDTVAVPVVPRANALRTLSTPPAATVLPPVKALLLVTTVLPEETRGRTWSLDPVIRAAAATDRGSAGLPVGVQVIGCPGRGEATVLEVMRRIE
jgi:Asp-tRNA(Asn)/Glu-tRNA(Gln) amidotransferase A subunit family amidase